MQVTLKDLNNMNKAQLWDYITGAAEEFNVDISDYNSRTKKDEMFGLALELAETSGELVNVTDEPDVIELADDPSMIAEFEDDDEFEDVDPDGDDWEYEEPDKARWQEANAEAAIEEPKTKKASKKKGEPRKRKFDAEQIKDILHKVETLKMSQSAVAKEFECSPTLIWNIRKGNVYSDITGRGNDTD